MISYLFDAIPLWVYITILCIAAAAAMYFFSPILVPLWNMLPRWVKIALGFIAAVALAFLGGKHKGWKNAQDRENQRNVKALETRAKVNHEVDTLSPGATHDKLSRWNRPDD